MSVKAGQAHAVRLWDVSSHRQLGGPLTGHNGTVYAVAFSPDGSTVASSSSDGTVRFWDVAGRRPVGGPIYGHTSDVYDVAFTPDGRTLVSVSSDKTIRLWNNKSFADYRDMLCRTINRQDAKPLWEQAEPDLRFPGVC
jgi:WD40 repeat protein